MDCNIKLFWDMDYGEIDRIYDVGEAEGALKAVMYMAPMDRYMFACFARNCVVFGAGFDQAGNVLGFFYLDGFEGATARLHFCFFEAGRKDRHALGHQVMEMCFKQFHLKALIGVVPSIYSGACDYAREVGGREVGRIPGMCWFERLRRNVGAVMFVFEPQEAK